jgi:hypothetical protein
MYIIHHAASSILALLIQYQWAKYHLKLGATRFNGYRYNIFIAEHLNPRLRPIKPMWLRLWP